MNMLTSLFDWFLAASFRASVLTLVVLAVQFLLQRHLSPRWRYALWLPVLVVLLMPVLPESRWSLENAFLSKPQPVMAPASPALEVSATDLPLTEPELAPAPVTIDWQNVRLMTWLAGAAGILLLGGLSFTQVLLRFKGSREPVDEELQSLVAQIAREVGLRRVPSVWVSPAISSPAVTGLLRPALLLPVRFDQSFTPGQARLVLQHELTHLKRHDLTLNALLCLLMA